MRITLKGEDFSDVSTTAVLFNSAPGASMRSGLDLHGKILDVHWCSSRVRLGGFVGEDEPTLHVGGLSIFVDQRTVCGRL